MFAHAIFTAKRKTPSIDLTIANMRDVGFDEPIHVFAEPGAEANEQDGVTVHRNPEQFGLVKNWREALKFLLSTTTEPWIILSEDDIECSPQTADILKDFCRLQQKQIGFISAYTSASYADTYPWLDFINDGWVNINRGWNTWGSQFIVIQRKSAKMLLLSKKMNMGGPNYHPVDAILGEYMQIFKMDCFYAVPSLIEHVGVTNSSLAHAVVNNYGYRYNERKK